MGKNSTTIVTIFMYNSYSRVTAKTAAESQPKYILVLLSKVISRFTNSSICVWVNNILVSSCGISVTDVRLILVYDVGFKVVQVVSSSY